MNYISGGYFCKGCSNYISNDDLYKHELYCKNLKSNQIKNQKIQEFDYREKDENSKKNEFSPINSFKNKNEDNYYNLNDGMITFGKNNTIVSNESNDPNNGEINPYKNFNQMKKTTSGKSSDNKGFNQMLNTNIREYEDNNEKFIKEESEYLEKFGGIGVTNRIGDNNSYLIVVLQTLWNLKMLRNYILYEMNIKDNLDERGRVFHSLKIFFKKYQNNLESKSQIALNTDKFKSAISDLFRYQKKFSFDSNDDPVDLYFTILNMFHSNFMKTQLNEINDTSCSSKCLAHKYFFLDLAKIDECECKGSSKRLYSMHNYIFDAPMEKIFELSENLKLLEMSKSIKKTGAFGLHEESSLADIKGKLFLYIKMLINKTKVTCPEKGLRCPINQVHKQFYLNNIPMYLAFNVANSQITNSSSMDVLKALLLIPRLLELSTIFQHNSKNKVFYEFHGAICATNYKSFTCFFSQINKDQKEWIFYEDEDVIYYKGYIDLISNLVKTQQNPVFLIYQIQESFTTDFDKELNNEEINRLEKLARSIDFSFNVVNKFRPCDDIIKYDFQDERMSSNDLKRNCGGNTNISTTNNSSNTSETNEYLCSHCFTRNKVDKIICSNCKNNNENIIKNLLLKRGSSEKSPNHNNAKNYPQNNYPNNDNNENSINKGIKEKDNPADTKISNIKHNKNTIDKLFQGQLDTHIKIINSSSKPKLLVQNNNYSGGEQSLGTEIPKKEIKESNKTKENNFINKDTSQEKNYDMPKQITAKSNTREASLNALIRYSKPEKSTENEIFEDICRFCQGDKSKNKCLCINPFVSETKKKPEKNYPNEDRIKPFKLEEKPIKVKQIKRLSDNDWECEICEKINSLPSYKCSNCGDLNKKIYQQIKQKEYNTNPKELIFNNKEKEHSKEKEKRGISEKKSEKNILERYNSNSYINNANNLTMKKNEVCKCKNDDYDHNQICRICKKKRTVNQAIVEPQKNKSVNTRYIGEPAKNDSYKNRSTSTQNEAKKESNSNNKSSILNDDKRKKSPVKNNFNVNNYHTADPRTASTKKKI